MPKSIHNTFSTTVDLTSAERERIRGSSYYNEALAPVSTADRTWNAFHIAILWVGLAVCIPSYQMASSLISMGLSWWESVLIVALGNLIILVPIILNSHVGTKYGIPFPVFARISFGVRGAHIPALVRSVIAAGWAGIVMWTGALSINAAIGLIVPAWSNFAAGIWISFAAFWMINIGFGLFGEKAVKKIETLGVPVLFVICIALFAWAVYALISGGFSLKVAFITPERGADFSFWTAFLGGLTANIGYWSTAALNIPDFSRYAKSQRDQRRGLLWGMPTTMTVLAFLGVFVTGTSIVIYGEALWDPIMIVERIGSPFTAFLGAVGIALASLTTNIAANLIPPANGISNLCPAKISFRSGMVITGILAILIQPWKLLADPNAYIFTWLNTYAIFTGPLAGIFIADYYRYRKMKISLAELYLGKEGRYWYTKGINVRAVAAWAISSLLPFLGLFIDQLSWITINGWIISFVISLFVYSALMKGQTSSLSE